MENVNVLLEPLRASLHQVGAAAGRGREAVVVATGGRSTPDGA